MSNISSDKNVNLSSLSGCVIQNCPEFINHYSNLNKEDYGRSYSLFFSEVKSDLIIRVGDLNNKDPDSDEEEFEVEEIFMHEGYDSKYYFLKD